MKKNSNIPICLVPVVVFCYENQRMNYCTVFNINSRKENCILFKTVWFYDHLPNLFDFVYLSTYLPINISIYLSIYLYNKALCLYIYIFNCMYIYICKLQLAQPAGPNWQKFIREPIGQKFPIFLNQFFFSSKFGFF